MSDVERLVRGHRFLLSAQETMMTCSTFDLFKIGIGPSSSHTMGPMVAAADFAGRLDIGTSRVETLLYGSLALTGIGHGTDRAIVLGLSGHLPATLDPDAAERVVGDVRERRRLLLDGRIDIAFDPVADCRHLHGERLDYHSNAMTLVAYDDDGLETLRRTYYSIGGGAVVSDDEIGRNLIPGHEEDIPYPFRSGEDLLRLADATDLTIGELVRANEHARRDPQSVTDGLAEIRLAMSRCIDRGIGSHAEMLPGGLRVKRRAPGVYKALVERQERALCDPLSALDWINLWALAVNEENAAGGRMVTAPTNGAAGIVPAVLRYYERFVPSASTAGAEDFLLTASAIGSLFKENASISGAEVGCQGEVGVACSMAAAGLAAALGATPRQIENAAEIGMEHNLGLTCDPVGGLVQVPCIERNAVGAIKAIEAARLAMLGDGTHRVTLDQVIETMRRTGLDMSERYKETSLGGLAVNVVEC